MKQKLILAATSLFSISVGSAANYLGNGNTGFGGVISSLDITDDGTNVTFVLNRGLGGLNDAFVLYIDSVAGGQNNTSQFTDSGDPLRQAISGFNGTTRTTVNLTSGFGVDRALALDQGFAGLWTTVDNGSHSFVTTANGSPGGTTQATYTMTVSLANLGLNPGDSFDFVATYLNPGAPFRSDEGIGDGLPTGNPGTSDVTFTGARTYTTIPEPTSAALGLLGSLLILRRRK
jgi:hypothetical protein